MTALRLSLVVMAVLSSFDPAPGQALAGFAKRLHGDTLDYHSADPDVTQGLLVRSLDATRSIGWETAAVPGDFDEEFASFVWLFGLDVEPGQHRFELRVDGEPWFTYRCPPDAGRRDWTLAGPDGSSLRFRATQIDRFGDLMGYATLRVPAARLTPGSPLRLEVGGETAGDRAWFITFMTPVAETAGLAALPALRRAPDGSFRPLTLAVTRLGPPVDARVTTSFGGERAVRLELGANHFELRCPAEQAAGEIRVEVAIDGRTVHALTEELEPLRRWTVDLVQHTHTDVGYTRPQTEILGEHLRFIDTALDLCDLTDDLPEPARFRWTCETSHAVREFVRTRPQRQLERLRRRVAEGRIELTGMFLNMSELVDEAGFAAFLAPIAELRDAGLEVTTAMQNDVNGAAWCLVDHFASLGIESLTMGQHGHRALAPFERPTCFRWESPAGERLLVWRADHYMTGNFHGVHTGSVEAVEPELLRYLSGLQAKGYPWSRVAVQHSGYPTDNAPPSLTATEVVRAWNERYEWPRLRCSINRDFLRWVAAEHGDELEVIRKAWPDWWTDGFGSAAAETAAARATQARRVAAESLLAMEAMLGVGVPADLRRQCAEIDDALLFYAEHTFGAAESIRQPFCENQQVQWREKAAYAWDAVKRTAMLTEAALGRLPVALERGEQPRLVVVNTLGHERSGTLELYADHELLPVDRRFRLVAEDGSALPVQWLRGRAEGSYWAIGAHDVPAFGWRTWRVEVDAGAAPSPRAPRRTGTVLENEHYRVQVDPRSGAVVQLLDKGLGRDLVDPDADWGLGLPLHEALSDREQLEAFHLVGKTRTAPRDVVVDGVAEGPLFSSLALRGSLPGCAEPDGVAWELRLHHDRKLLEFCYTARVRRSFEPDGLYVAFGFGPAAGARLCYEVQGGVVDAGADVLPGAATDWQTMQGFVAARWNDAQVVLSSEEVPLVQLGGIRLGEFARAVRIERPHVYGWVMNDYWTTNFLAGQEGDFRFRYALTSGRTGGDAQADGAASRFGHGHRVPLLGRAMPGGGARPTFERRSLWPFADREGLALIAARPLPDRDDGALLHLRELAGEARELPATVEGGWRIRAADLLGRPRASGDASSCVVAPRASVFLRLEPR